MRRRGLIAGAAALAVGLFARSSTEVSAANGGNLVLGSGGNANNTATDTTLLASTGTATPAHQVKNAAYAGTVDTTADAVQGFTAGTGNSGLLGRNDDLNGVGVYGIASNGTGIAGQSVGGSAISASSVSGAGVFASSTSGFGTFSQSSSNYGVYGSSGSTAGVFGLSNTGYGVQGAIGAGGVAALYGSSTFPNVPAFYAVNYGAPANSNAGFFIGQVYINGPFIVVGGAKSAAVPHPDGSHRLLYCVESPESWFEDFGEGTITGGKAEVKLDHDFAVTVDTSTLHVFLTSHDEAHHLAVKTRSGGSFSVAADVSSTAAARGVKATDVSGTFTYRVVAKRKDVAAPRFAKFDLPKPPPPPPQLPTAPHGPARHKDGPVTKH